VSLPGTRRPGLGQSGPPQGSPVLPDCGAALVLARANGLAFETPGGAYLRNHRSASQALPVTESVVLPPICEGSIMPQSQRLPSVLPFAAIGRPTCPKCKAPMMLASIEPAGAQGVDLQTFECAICNRVLETLVAYEDPMKSKALGRWLQGDLHPPK
jgi:hypothetical protein